MLLPLLAFFGFPVWADNVSFSFAIVNAPGGIGDFSWTITLPALDESVDTEAWNAISNPTTGGGCKIDEIELLAENAGYGMTTFFSPLCNGLYDSETSGFAVSPSEFGTYTFSGTNPDDTKNFATFTIFRSNLPITTPEPSDFTVLLVGLITVGYSRRRRAR
ncbi:MAG: hypothetical protein ACRD3B_03630 [Candidatus Sulfotelmatobacter sp.]